MFCFYLWEMAQREILKESPKYLPEEMAEAIAHDILSSMPEDVDIADFASVAMNQIAMKMAIEAEKLAVKIPTAQELIAYAGEFDERENYSPWGTKLNKKDFINKLANSQYDLSDFADITYNKDDKNAAARIVIAAAHKGKFIHLEIGSHDSDCDDYTKEKILKKCTMH